MSPKAAGALAALALAACATPPPDGRSTGKEQAVDSTSVPILIAHRGASGERPEHTIASYALAIEQGADFIEPDLVLTRDGVLVARHENNIADTSDVAERPEFADRKATKVIDGEKMTGWFTEDFTLAELRTLRARERLPQLRPANRDYDGQEAIPTFDEIVALARRASRDGGRTIGVYPETKHPTYFAALSLPHAPPLLDALRRAGWTTRDAPVVIQSFEVENLRALRAETGVRLVQLLAASGAPADRPDLPYATMASAAGLRDIAAYADGIGPDKAMVIPRTKLGRLGQPTSLVRDAHAAGLVVHPWTFRRENYFLPPALWRGIDPRGVGDLAAEIRAFRAAGVDGLFSDNPADARAALDAD